jgi:hypothetical protein
MMSGRDQEPSRYYVGIDVGTGSVRAALVDQRGLLLAFAEQPIKKWEPQFNHHEQSSEDIWAACCLVTKVRAEPRQPLPVHAPAAQQFRMRVLGLHKALEVNGGMWLGGVGFAFQKQTLL